MTSAPTAEARHAAAEVDAKSPWRFLTPLNGDSAADRDLIELTRPDELRNVLDMITTSRVSLLYAFSGNGKTSLIEAGIIPQLRHRGYAVFKTRPRPPESSRDPLRAFKDSVLAGMNLPLFTRAEMRRLRELRAGVIGGQAPLLPEVKQLLATLEDKICRAHLTSPDTEFAAQLTSRIDLPLVKFVAEIQRYVGVETRLLFVCDQFEELFVHYQSSPESDRFIRELGEVWADGAINVHFVFSMREDWVGSMIAFRHEIPEIFASYFRLSPLTRSQAVRVLERPLTQLGLKWEEGAVFALLDDLARAYSVNQADRFSGVNLALSAREDPYIELPALHVVAEQLWRTRSQHPRPFSLAHYLALPELTGADPARQDPDAQRSTDESAAQCILRHFLRQKLGVIAAREPPGRELTELRIDCLYALTDRTRHRRALAQSALLEEVRRLRPAALALQAVEPASVEAALRPMILDGIVRRSDGTEGGAELELAHDFAVRLVVELWRGLDQKRVAAVALQQREREERDAALAEVTTRERRRLRLIKYIPFISVGAVVAILATFLPWWGRQREIVFRLAILVLPFLLTPLATLSISARRFVAAAAAFLSLGSIVAVASLETDFLVRGPATVPAIHALPVSVVGRHLNTGDDVDFIGILTPREGEIDITSDAAIDLLSASGTRGAFPASSILTDDWSWGTRPMTSVRLPAGLSWLRIYRRYYLGFKYSLDMTSEASPPQSVLASSRPSVLDVLSSVAWSPETSTSVLLGLVVIVLIVLGYWNLFQLAEFLGSRLDWRIVRLEIAELIDTLEIAVSFTAATIGLSGLAVARHTRPDMFSLYIEAFLISALLTGSLHLWLGRTPGLAVNGFRLVLQDGSLSTRLLISCRRQALFSLWALLSISCLLLPSFIVTPLIVRRSRLAEHLYDTLAGTHLVDLKGDSGLASLAQPTLLRD